MHSEERNQQAVSLLLITWMEEGVQFIGMFCSEKVVLLLKTRFCSVK
jgi:hypothetical protein